MCTSCEYFLQLCSYLDKTVSFQMSILRKAFDILLAFLFQLLIFHVSSTGLISLSRRFLGCGASWGLSWSPSPSSPTVQAGSWRGGQRPPHNQAPQSSES